MECSFKHNWKFGIDPPFRQQWLVFFITFSFTSIIFSLTGMPTHLAMILLSFSYLSSSHGQCGLRSREAL